MDDLISRQAAIETALEYFVEFQDGAFHEDDQRVLKSRLEELPSVQKTGQWIERKTDPILKAGIYEVQSAKCSVCGKYHTTPYLYFFHDYEFCPNCGAKMVDE